MVPFGNAPLANSNTEAFTSAVYVGEGGRPVEDK